MRHLSAVILVLVLTTLVLGCPQTVPSPTFAHVPDTELCPDMCTRFRVLKCAEGQDYYDSDKAGPHGVPNTTCEEFCTTQQGNGIYENPRCLSKVPSCDLIEAWRKKDCSVDGGT